MNIAMIINPSSGHQNSQENLNYIHDNLSKDHRLIRSYTEKKDDAKNYAKEAIGNDHDLIIVAGGDGTLNEVANAIGESKKSIPIAVYPSGTSNDFATYFNIASDPDKFLQLIEDFHIKEVDLGQLNDLNFINVAAIGNIADVAEDADDFVKAKIGRLAYIFNAIGRLPEFFENVPTLHIKTQDFEFEEEVLIMLISNTKRVGGFNNICPRASTDDGLFDVLIVKNSNLINIAEVFLKILSGNHLDDDNIIYFQTDRIRLNTPSKDPVISVDGENIHGFPLDIRVHKRKMKILVHR